MFLNTKLKDKVCHMSLHIELIMWGDDFLEFSKEFDETAVNWLSICEGGDVDDKGDKQYSREVFTSLIDYLFSIDFPEQEDKEMNLSWEILCFDENEDVVISVPFGYWKREVLIDIVSYIQELLGDDRPLLSIIRTINA